MESWSDESGSGNHSISPSLRASPLPHGHLDRPTSGLQRAKPSLSKAPRPSPPREGSVRNEPWEGDSGPLRPFLVSLAISVKAPIPIQNGLLRVLTGNPSPPVRPRTSDSPTPPAAGRGEVPLPSCKGVAMAYLNGYTPLLASPLPWLPSLEVHFAVQSL